MSLVARTACPICDQPSAIVAALPYADPRFAELMPDSRALPRVADKDFEIRECKPCQLLFQTWVFDADEADLIYATERPADIPAAIAAQAVHSLAHNAEEVLVMRQVCKARTPRVLDYGCGWGKFGSMALAYGCEVYGHEVNTTCAGFCASRGIKMLTLAEIAAHRFDFINIDQVLEHVADPRGILDYLTKSLNADGLIKVSVPGSPTLRKIITQNPGNADAIVRKEHIKPLFPLMHVTLFAPKSLKALGASVGLEPFRPPFSVWLGAGQMWNKPRQFNRNLVNPFKRIFHRGTYLWLQKRGAR